VLLSALLLVPLAGAGAVLLLPSRAPQLVRGAALLASGAVLALACALLALFDPAGASIQFFETYRWHPRFGTSFSLGVDGVSLPLVALAALLGLVAVLASGGVGKRVKGYFALLLLLESAVLGVFTARDWSLFYIFWELTLIPLFFLIDRYGGSDHGGSPSPGDPGRNRHRAAINFVLYTMGGSVFMLVSLLVLFDASPGHSFAMESIREGGRGLAAAAQVTIFLGLLVGFGVKMPVFPLHGWLPLAHVEAPSPVSILLSGILLKMGSYGLIRAVETLPLAAAALQGWLAVLALTSLIYGGVLAWRQRDLKAMVAYSSVSHMGVVLLGIAALNQAGLTGAVMQMVAHGLVAGALFLLVGQLYERTHTRDVAAYGSLIRVTPRFAFFIVIAFIGAVGMPGTAGFIAEIHALVGGFERWGAWVAVMSLGVLVSAAYSVRTVGRLLTGPPRPEMAGIADLEPGEVTTAAVLCAGIVVLGFVPAPVLSLIGPAVRDLSRVFAP
jgi:NADH-quinone oxidoreductase subunit M